jgi:hypothetical protein
MLINSSLFLLACAVVALQPLETLTGLLTQPGFTGKQPMHQEALAKVTRRAECLQDSPDGTHSS